MTPDEALNLIHKAAEKDLELNHLSAELHGNDLQRAMGAVQTLLSASQQLSLERVLANPTLQSP